MKIYKDDKIFDITCDVCQKSCKIMDGDEDSYEFLEIKGTFGYYSNHDGERWYGQICEKCVETYLEKIICFEKKEYHLMNPFDEYPRSDKMNRKSDRIRKIRKLMGDVEFDIIPKKV